jgi:hypothetical protein
MYYITYNDVITPHPYDTREDAIRELQETFAGINIDNDIAYWPSISTRGHVKIEIKQYDGELE